MKLRHKYEDEFAKNPSYIEMYRRGNTYEGALTRSSCGTRARMVASRSATLSLRRRERARAQAPRVGPRRFAAGIARGVGDVGHEGGLPRDAGPARGSRCHPNGRVEPARRRSGAKAPCR